MLRKVGALGMLIMPNALITSVRSPMATRFDITSTSLIIADTTEDPGTSRLIACNKVHDRSEHNRGTYGRFHCRRSQILWRMCTRYCFPIIVYTLLAPSCSDRNCLMSLVGVSDSLAANKAATSSSAWRSFAKSSEARSSELGLRKLDGSVHLGRPVPVVLRPTSMLSRAVRVLMKRLHRAAIWVFIAVACADFSSLIRSISTILCFLGLVGEGLVWQFLVDDPNEPPRSQQLWECTVQPLTPTLFRGSPRFFVDAEISPCEVGWDTVSIGITVGFGTNLTDLSVALALSGVEDDSQERDR